MAHLLRQVTMVVARGLESTRRGVKKRERQGARPRFMAGV
jgi:hypothetical protein